MAIAGNVGVNGTYSMEDVVSVAELEPAEDHSHPGLDVGGEEDERAVVDYLLQFRRQEFENEIQIRFRRENIEEL